MCDTKDWYLRRDSHIIPLILCKRKRRDGPVEDEWNIQRQDHNEGSPTERTSESHEGTGGGPTRSRSDPRVSEPCRETVYNSDRQTEGTV